MGATLEQSTLVMSPWLGTPGKRAATMRAAYWFLSSRPCLSGGSYWHTQVVTAPKTASTALSRPPYPEHSEPILSGPAAGAGEGRSGA